MTASPEPDSHSRRALLAAGTGSALAMLAGCSGSNPLRVKLRSGVTVQGADVLILNGLLGLEQHAIAGYTAGIPLLDHSVAKAAQQFLSQELAHSQALSDLIRKAGGKPNEPPPSYDLGHPTTNAQVLALFRDLESAQLAAYVRMIPLLTPGRLRSAVAAIFANDAQHLAFLHQQLGQVPVPTAFVTGH